MNVYSNLNAKDALHFSTAVAAAQSQDCDFFITSDGDLYKESNQLIKDLKMQNKIKIMKPKDFIEKYPPIKKNERSKKVNGNLKSRAKPEKEKPLRRRRRKKMGAENIRAEGAKKEIVSVSVSAILRQQNSQNRKIFVSLIEKNFGGARKN